MSKRCRKKLILKNPETEPKQHLKAAHVIALKRVKKEEDVLVVTRNYAHFYHVVKLTKNPKRF
uniref:Uncharacterized protein n=1 Tax=Bombyx mori TaxID=7091 RepID=A0A8R2R4E5_BOMMO|nr:uncharacterized protein LOC119629699 isoform X2 [Bombyx mori]